MKEFISQYWLTLAVSVYILAMVLYGHYRGFVKRAVSLVALVASLVIVRMGTPYVTDLLKENTAVRQIVQEKMVTLAGLDDTISSGGAMPAAQRAVIEDTNLPESLKRSLIENNNSEVYQMLGVERFSDYIADYLSNLICSVIGSVILFVLSYIAIRLLLSWADVISKLPVLSGMNQIAGAALGAVESLAVLWLLGLMISIGSGTPFGKAAVVQIESSMFLAFLYQNNPFQWVLMSILAGILR